MTIEVGKGGGIFVPEVHVVGQVIASGQTGDLVTIGTLGKITKITYLAASTSATQTGINIEVDGNDLTTPSELTDVTPIVAGAIGVYTGNSATSTAPTIGRLAEVTGEIIKIKKDAGNTTQSIILSYVTGALS